MTDFYIAIGILWASCAGYRQLLRYPYYSGALVLCIFLNLLFWPVGMALFGLGFEMTIRLRPFCRKL